VGGRIHAGQTGVLFHQGHVYQKTLSMNAEFYADKMADTLSIQPIKRVLAIFKANECGHSLQHAERCL